MINMANFSYFDKPIENIDDSSLIRWYIAFCNGADIHNSEDCRDYAEFIAEVPNRNKEFKDSVRYIDSVL